MEYFPYYLSYFFSLSLGIYSLTKRKSLTAILMSILAFSQAIMIHFFIYEALASTFKFKILYDDIQFIALLFYCIILLAFTYAYTESFNKMNIFFLSFFTLVFLVISFFKFIPLYENLFRIKKMIIFKNNFIDLTYQFGIILKLTYFFIFILSSYVFYLLLINAVKSKNEHKLKSILIFCSFFIQIIIAFLSISNIKIYNFRNNMPLAFGCSAFFIFIAAFKFKALDYIPDFLKDIVQNFDDPVIITDDEFIIIDHNRMANNLFGITIKKNLSDFKYMKDLPGHILDDTNNEITLAFDDEEYIFEIKSNKITSKNNIPIGFVFIFHNITTIRRSEQAIRMMRNNLESMVNERVKDLKIEIEHRKNTELELQRLYDELRVTQKEIMFTLSEVVENRSKETANHVIRVSYYSYLLSKLLGLDQNTSELIRDASPLHDIGKIAIPDTILHKPAVLTDEERLVIQNHTLIGHEILSKSNRDLLKIAALIALEHHERWDGEGYPNKKKQDDISIYGRIVSLVDVFDALLAKRVYKAGWDKEKVISYIIEESGKQFDPAIVDVLINNIDEFFTIQKQYPEE
ncbi:MAG: hypothetical protein A2015_10405 [Spirochaetes bacterium GWF1_31_7]|nr:MAG: hypothetical protein A2Y30_16145 [Spirochaetes bacterium GWE1_32_154]OHD48510.1 MAG: hypothetical protein A2Y29_14120 [Spirochaetes bacterium GWE2_31_10]OHD51424.1 MAG: hypothetical protein A2015_10405 [Spirochaetes bacterium GWF1_31_7]HBD93361.1 hypothetical protein [Spirochaetia bacterium]HBI36692.1 hypothetical protein [Spirochaetia bacterium]